MRPEPESAAQQPRAKKSVALSGVVAGNTALSTVGASGDELRYRGYDVKELAGACEYEEVAHLLIHGPLPDAAQLRAYKEKLRALRALPAAVKTVLEAIPAAAHPMDVMRSGVSALGAVLPENEAHPEAGARDIADRTFVTHLYDGAPAQKAGLRVGDEIVSVNGQPYRPLESFKGQAGREVTVQVRRRAGAAPISIEVPVAMLRPNQV
mgnify:CR=1 FL=1